MLETNPKGLPISAQILNDLEEEIENILTSQGLEKTHADLTAGNIGNAVLRALRKYQNSQHLKRSN